MKTMSRRTGIMFIFLLLFFICTAIFLFYYIRDGAAWATYPTNRHLYIQGKLTFAGDIFDRNGTVLVSTNEDKERIYNEDSSLRRALMHIAGDREGNVATGAQVVFRRELTGWNFISGAYRYGGIETGGNDITLTIDSQLSLNAYKALGGRSGAVGVMNYKTGEILCAVSSPSFDPDNPPDTEDSSEYEGVYINRLISAAYTPGSIFKLVTAAAYLETVDTSFSYSCKGEYEIDGDKITCPRAHGKQTLAEAMTNSCNCAFAEIALSLDSVILEDYAKKAGFGKGTQVNGINTARGSFSLNGAKDIDIAWSGAGQYKTLCNPLSFMAYCGAIARGGTEISPYLLKNVTTKLGIPLHYNISLPGARIMSEETAAALGEMMRDNVLNNYGEIKGLSMCAKSGTAEVGGGKTPHAWFAGFLQDEENPLCFIVIIENGGSGSQEAGKIASSILKSYLL